MQDIGTTGPTLPTPAIEHLWDVVEREILIMDVQLTNLQKLRDAIMSIWTKISEEYFQHLVESMPRRIKTVLKAKYWQGVLNKVVSGLSFGRCNWCGRTCEEAPR